MRNTTTALINVKSSRLSLVLLIIVLIVLSGCDRVLNASSFNNMSAIEKNSEIIGGEKDEIVGDVSKGIYQSIDRANEKAEAFETSGIPKSGVEVKVPEGRYTIQAGSAGNVFIYDEEGELLMRELFDGMFGVESIELDIGENYTLFFDGGLYWATLSPTETTMSNELSSGIWEVGVDIEAGNYVVTADEGTLGYLQVFEIDEEVQVYELMSGDTLQTTSEVQLIDGQKLKITGIPLVVFNPK